MTDTPHRSAFRCQKCNRAIQGERCSIGFCRSCEQAILEFQKKLEMEHLVAKVTE